MMCVNENLETDLVEMKADGSSRKVIISDLRGRKANRLLLHRGVIYYTVESFLVNGKQKNALMAMSLLSGNKEPETVYELAGTGRLS